jgi:hypothetical protein
MQIRVHHAAGEVVQQVNFMASLAQALCQEQANETCAAGDQ